MTDFQWLTDYTKVILEYFPTFLSVATVFALGLSIYQTYQTNRQMKAARIQTESAIIQTESLEKIRLSLSTRYLGVFPDFVNGITDIIKDSKREITICCDFPGYAFLTANNDWLEYRNTLEKKLGENIKVELAVPNEVHRRRLNSEVFAFDESQFKDWKNRKNIYFSIESLIKSNGLGISVSELNIEDFLNLIEKEDQKILKNHFFRAEIIELDFVSNLLFWIVDEKVAIFSFASLSFGILEHGFITYDRVLLNSFRDIRNRYEKTSKLQHPRQ